MKASENTSTTLLRELASSSQHARWAEFVHRYQPMMAAYLRSHFPDVDVDDVISETLIALVDVLKNYRYSPNETGRFHNYLTGVLRHKALRIYQRESRIKDLHRQAAAELVPVEIDSQEEDYRSSLFNIAVDQFFHVEIGRARSICFRCVVA